MKLTIARSDAATRVSVEVKVGRTEEPFDFKNTAMLGVQDLDAHVTSVSPFLTYRAIESACISGAIYARSKLHVEGLAVELLSFTWTGTLENAEPFAIAVMVAVAKALAIPTPTLEHQMGGWSDITA